MTADRRSFSSLFTRRGVPLWRDVEVLQWVAQVVSAIVVIGFLIFFISNVLRAAEVKGLSLGYDFINLTAGRCRFLAW